MCNLHIYTFYMRNKVVSLKLEICVENSYQIWIDIPFHLQELSKGLIFEEPSDIVQLLAFQPIKANNFRVVYHFGANLKSISLN